MTNLINNLGAKLTEITVPLSLILAAIVCFLLIALGNIVPAKINITEVATGSSTTAELPLAKFGTNPASDYKVTFNVNRNLISQTKWRVNADDCLKSIKINDKDVPFTELTDKRGFCQYGNLGEFNLGPYLNYGRNNKVEMVLSNAGGTYMFNLLPSFSDPVLLSLFGIALVCLLVGVYLLSKKYRWSWWLIGLFGVAGILRLWYLGYTEYHFQSYDLLGTGHWGYVQYVSNEWRWPDPLKGWGFYNPPLYYFLAAPIVWLLRQWNMGSPEIYIRLLSFVFYTGFVWYAYKTICLFFQSKKVRNFSLALMLLWPSSIMHSLRITNDILFTLLFAAAVYYLCRWYLNALQKGQMRLGGDLLIYALLTGFAIITKSNSLILIPLFGILWCLLVIQLLAARSKGEKIKWLRDEWKRLTLVGILTCLIFVPFLGINFIRPIQIRQQKPDYNLLVGAISNLSSGLKINNTPANFLYFDAQDYLQNAFVNPWKDEGGRQFLPNYLLKTSLYGEFTYRPEIQKTLAYILSICVLILTVLMIVYIMTMGLDNLRHTSPLLFTILLLIMSVVTYRWQHPFSANQDFRFIIPVIGYISPFMIAALDRFKPPFVRTIAWSALIIFLLCSALFIVTGAQLVRLN
jgi:Dolichyl-phosphate-mannose-protein mannosyltransferase